MLFAFTASRDYFTHRSLPPLVPFFFPLHCSHSARSNAEAFEHYHHHHHHQQSRHWFPMLSRLFPLVRIFRMGKRPADKELMFPRIKDIRKRPRAVTPTGGAAGSQPSGAFSSLSAAPSTPTLGFSAAPAQSNGFAFGQSQSFPGASHAPSQPNQGGSASFSFGGSGSTGFNFASGFGSSSSNPFASNSFSAGTSAPSQPASSTGTAGFVGFGNQSSSQPPFSGSLFGAQQSQTAPAPSAPIFGQAATSSTANFVSESMQTSPDAKSKAPSFNADSSSAQKNFLGGSSASGLFSPKPATTPAGNLFGGLSATSTINKPSSDKPEEPAPKPAFAAQASTPSTQTKPFGSLFGTSAMTSPVSGPEKSVTPQPATTNPFALKPTEEANSLFASRTVSSEAEKPVTSQPATTNIFSAQPATAATTNNLFGPKPPSKEPTTPSTASTQFKPANEQATSTMSNFFAPKPAAGQQVSDKSSEAQPFKPLFGSSPAATTTAPAATPGLFSQRATADKPAETQPFKSLFGAPPTPSQPTGQTPALFAPKPAVAQATDKPASTQPFGSLFGSPTTAPKPSEPALSRTTPTAPSNLFSPKPPASETSGNMFGAKTAAPEPKAAQPPVDPAATAASAQSLSDRIPKPDFPDSASKEVTAEAEMVWKVRSLDHFFKQEILSYEPGTDAFDNLVLFYMRARQALGAPVRSKGPVKLSNGIHTHLETPNHVAASPAKQTPSANPSASATSNLFSQSFSSSPARPEKQAPAANPTVSATSNSFSKPFSSSPAQPATSIGLSQAKSPSPPTFTPAPKANPFASMPSENAATASQTPGTQGAAAMPAIPKFGNGSSGTDFMAQFKKKAEQSMAEEKAKRKAEDFDSDEDDEVEWERRDAEKQREKHAKLEAASNKKAVFIPGQGFKFVDADEEAAASPATSASQPTDKSPMTGASPAPSSGSIFGSASRPLPNSENIFGRLSATPQPADTGKDSDESDNEAKAPSQKRRASDDANGEDDFADALHNSKRSKPSENTEISKSSLDIPLPAPSATAGRSLFDRIQSPAPQNESATSNLFSASLNKATAAPSDNTWKPNSPIKFSSTSAPSPAFAVAPTPPVSTQSSAVDTTTSGDATPDEETAPGAIFDMTNANAGEEDEEVAFECRARAFKLATGWTPQGTGVVRLLKHPATGRSRIVLRADPGGNIILNTLLKKEFDYSRANNSVQFMVPQANNQKPEHWAVRVRSEFIGELYNTIHAIKN